MKPQCSRLKMSRAASICLDVLILLIAAATLVIVEFVIPNFNRGFTCGDPAISFKFQGDTISTTLLICSGLLPIIFIWVTEIFLLDSTELEDGKKRFRTSFRKTIGWFKDYAITLVLLLLVVDIIKVLIGEPRPHFLDTCQPKEAENCVKGTFIEDFTCTNQIHRPYFVKDSSRSFPSGHAAISVYSSLFMIWYLQIRLPKLDSMFFVPLLQSLLMVWMVLCSMSRITDHRHHWWDVLTGVVIGFLFAYYSCKLLYMNSKKVAKQQTNEHGSSHNGKTRSVRRLISSMNSTKEEFTLNNIEL